MAHRILLFGKNGQVSSALVQRLASLGLVAAHDRTTCDLEKFDQICDVIRRTRPDVIVNAAAYTAVDRAEDDEAVCRRINAEAPAIIAQEARKINAHLIHYSTDYVFDGRQFSPYREDDAPHPINAYGRSKLEGDMAVLQSGASATVLRVSWVYGVTGRNFAKTILRLALERDELKIVDDQFGAPTSADLIADVTTRVVGRILLERNSDSQSTIGLFNLASGGQVSWHGYAIELVEAASVYDQRLKQISKRLIPVRSSEFSTRAARPHYSVLDTTKICRALSLSLPEWRQDIRRFARELLPT